MPKPLVLMVLDGWGIAPATEHNMVHHAPTPRLDALMQRYPNVPIQAAEEGVGLIPGHQGSSEIGHYILGAGRNVLLPQSKVMMAAKTGELFRNDAYREAMRHVVREQKEGKSSALHLMGLLSSSGVHAYDETCYKLIEMAAREGVKTVYVHVFADGRDMPPRSILPLLKKLEVAMKKHNVGTLATVVGRFYAMDRDHRWDRTELAWRSLALGQSKEQATSGKEAVEKAYARGEGDEFIEPTKIVDSNNNPVGIMHDGDAVIHWNFRVDRAIQLAQAFVEDEFEGFTREVYPRIFFVATCEYYRGLDAPVAFSREEVPNSFAEVLSHSGIHQLRVAETEKWVYFTTIFNSMREEAFPGEDRILIPSDKVRTYDLKPEMKAIEIAEAAVKGIESGKYDFIAMNFANPDILGHTGVREAIKKGITTVDTAVGKVVDATLARGGVVLITADHGNPEIGLDKKSGQTHTFHTTSDVPCVMIGPDEFVSGVQLRKDGALKDVAPTMLEIMDIEKPREMTGESLIIRA